MLIASFVDLFMQLIFNRFGFFKICMKLLYYVLMSIVSSCLISRDVRVQHRCKCSFVFQCGQEWSHSFLNPSTLVHYFILTFSDLVEPQTLRHVHAEFTPTDPRPNVPHWLLLNPFPPSISLQRIILSRR